MVYKYEDQKCQITIMAIPYELLIRHNTVITNLGIYEPNNTFTNKPIPTELSNIMNTYGYISKFLYLFFYIFFKQISFLYI